MTRHGSAKDQRARQLRRKQGHRPTYDRILIVSEGTKTEPNYFNEIRRAFRLPTAFVQVQPSGLGTDPMSVVKYAKGLFEDGDTHNGIEARAFEKVFAVFDRDDHLSYFDALDFAKSLDNKLRNDLKQAVGFQAIASVPSFELWLLLHFADIQAQLHRDEVLRRVKQHLPGYEKGAQGMFENTRGQLDVATQRAGALATRFSAYDAPQPFTAVDGLVNLLVSLRPGGS